MEDISGKLGSILSDPRAMQEIAALASKLGVDASGTDGGSESAGSSAQPQHTSAQGAGILDMLAGAARPSAGSGGGATDQSTLSMLGSLAPMLGSLNGEDDTTRLLDAIRPFLSGERQKKLDRAKKLIRMMRLLPMLRELELFN